MNSCRFNLKKIIMVMVVILFGIFFLAGCATLPDKSLKPVIKAELKKPALHLTEMNYELGEVVVRAGKPTKLELKKMEAVRLNNKDTTGVVVGSAGAIAAFTAANLYLGKKYSPWVSLAVSAGAAYAAVGITGLVFDLLTKH